MTKPVLSNVLFYSGIGAEAVDDNGSFVLICFQVQLADKQRNAVVLVERLPDLVGDALGVKPHLDFHRRAAEGGQRVAVAAVGMDDVSHARVHAAELIEEAAAVLALLILAQHGH